MTDQEILAAFKPMFASFINLVELADKPLLAHYTSLDAIEKITRSGELWFSNPLFMNDLQEVRFGMIEGHRIFIEEFSDENFINAVGRDKVSIITDAFRQYYIQFDETQALDVYVFCLTQHDPTDNDGLLSMWRGYGANGGGAAMVINTDFITLREESPLFIGKVKYASDNERREWIKKSINEVKTIVMENKIEDGFLFHIAFHVFQVLKFHAILSKHCGFKEEQEWRVIYLPERDQNNILTEGYTYIIGKNGIEPRLRFPIKPLPFEDPADWTFESIVERIILGPSLSSTLATNAVRKMFMSLGRQPFAQKVVASTIPYRAA